LENIVAADSIFNCQEYRLAESIVHPKLVILMPDRKRFPETPETSLWVLKRIVGDGAGGFDARKIASDRTRSEGTGLNFRP
jgi:hypothetical protein